MSSSEMMQVQSNLSRFPSSREAILASGGHITPATAARTGLDVDIIVRDTRAGAAKPFCTGLRAA